MPRDDERLERIEGMLLKMLPIVMRMAQLLEVIESSPMIRRWIKLPPAAPAESWREQMKKRARR